MTEPPRRLRQLGRLTAGYGLTALAGPVFSVLLTPIIVAALRAADYAVWDSSLTIGILALSLGSLGLHWGMAVLFYDGDEQHGRRVVSTTAAVSTLWAALLALGLAALARPLAAFAYGDPAQARLVYLIALNLPLAVLNQVIAGGLRLRLAAKQANALALSYIVLNPLVTIACLVGLRLGVFGILLATLLVTALLTIASLALTWRTGWAWPERALVRPLLRAGLPLLPNTLAFWALAYVDRLLLPLFGISLADRGLYGLAARLAALLTIPIGPFQQAWGPLSLAMREDPDAPQLYARVLTLYSCAALGLGLLAGLFAREGLLLLGWLIGRQEYLPAAPYIGVLAYYVVANGAVVAVGVGAYLAKRTELPAIATLLGAGLNLALNLVLIPRYGTWGAAWATALGYGVVPFVLYWLAQRAWPLPLRPRRTLLALGAQAALLALGAQIASGNVALGVALKLAVLAAYPALLLALRVLTIAEARAVWRRLTLKVESAKCKVQS